MRQLHAAGKRGPAKRFTHSGLIKTQSGGGLGVSKPPFRARSEKKIRGRSSAEIRGRRNNMERLKAYR
jgi:hypothetical protein